MKDIANTCKTLIDGYSSSCFLNGRWHTTWFLGVENLCPLKDEAPKYGQEVTIQPQN
jgi:hypothetical protein